MANDSSGTGDADDEDASLVGVATGAVTFLTLGVAFGLLFLDVSYFWVAFPVGFGGGMPLAVSLAKWYESNRSDGRERSPAVGSRAGQTGEADDALDALRDRYARGEIDEAEFEARVERLLETESVDDAEAFLGRAGESSENDEREAERA